jgi:hypothetical protein
VAGRQVASLRVSGTEDAMKKKARPTLKITPTDLKTILYKDLGVVTGGGCGSCRPH